MPLLSSHFQFESYFLLSLPLDVWCFKVLLSLLPKICPLKYFIQRTDQTAYISCDITVKTRFIFTGEVFFCGLTEAVMVWTCRRTSRETWWEVEDRHVSQTEGTIFLCVGRLRDTSVLLAEGRPDNLDTTSTTNCYSITEHRLTAAIQRHSPPQLHSYLLLLN